MQGVCCICCIAVTIISLCSIKAGDIALFVSDSYGNYLALVSDSKIYYLNQGSIPKVKDLSALGKCGIVWL